MKSQGHKAYSYSLCSFRRLSFQEGLVGLSQTLNHHPPPLLSSLGMTQSRGCPPTRWPSWGPEAAQHGASHALLLLGLEVLSARDQV